MDSSQSAWPAPDVTVYAPEPAVEPRRAVTASQVANAITQLRERRGQSAAMQMQAVLGALGLTVVPDTIIPTARSESQLSSGPCAACLESISGTNRPGNHTCW
jgi:hypothetical protein